MTRRTSIVRSAYGSSIRRLARGDLARQPVGGVVPNKVFPLLEGTPRQLVFTPNSETPYSAVAVDLSVGRWLVPPGWARE